MDLGAIIKAGTGALGGVLSAALLPVAGPLAPVIGGAVGTIGGAIGDSMTAGSAKDAESSKQATGLVKKVAGLAPSTIIAKPAVEVRKAAGAPKDPEKSNTGLLVALGLGALALLGRK